nr:DUF1015 domain-containing protein [uncultured Desulfuromonas sp.]
MTFEHIGLQVPEILLPKHGTQMHYWSVIACDQYTSDRSYWQRLEQQTAGKISTLNLIFPEVNLEDDDAPQRIEKINQTMRAYLADGSLEKQPSGFILIDRSTCEVSSRKGLMVALDLEQYDYTPGSKSLIRATEGTIVDRLPPRIKVRENAPIELPHIMVLIDDPEQTVIEPLFNENLETVYDFDLLENGGHIRGLRVDQPGLIEQVVTALNRLMDTDRFQQRYQTSDNEVMLYAMGDGNHSFATAKAIWEQLKRQADDPQTIMDHPARYALVELVNLHDAGLEFEPIHRVLFDVEEEHLLTSMKNWYQDHNLDFEFIPCSDLQQAKEMSRADDEEHSFPCVISGFFGLCRIRQPHLTLVVGTLQEFLDDFLKQTPAARIDYIHGSKSVTALGSVSDAAGFYLPAINKHDLFRTIVHDGALPRKTFSMGEADEKRFYLECRKITAS